jgi:dihydrofolate synthase / folylpolyglutamate synthase
MSLNYGEMSSARARLASLPQFATIGTAAMSEGLTGIRRLCGVLDHPHKRYRSIHVAGTNGKGTVCHLAASMLQAGGLKTGLYTSPHLIDVSERVRVDGQPISDEGMDRFDTVVAGEMAVGGITYFEYTTAMAFWWFAECGVDWAVIETGLGGRLDSTNILQPEVAVITSIGLDHQDILGPRLADIAREKAGILKPGVRAVIGPIPAECEGIFDAHPDCERVSGKSMAWESDIASSHTALHIALADAATREVVSEQIRKQGVLTAAARTGLMGRMERLRADRDWFFDGAHNAQALEALMAHVGHRFPGRTPVWVLAFMNDKLTPELAAVVNRVEHGYFLALTSPRAASMADLTSAGIRSLQALPDLRMDGPPFDRELNLVMLAGSFYFYPTAKSRLSAR